MTWIILLPVLSQMLIALILLFGWRKPRVQEWGSMAGGVLHVVLGLWLFATVWSDGTISVQAGDWGAPFGITFVADALAALLVLITGIVGLAVSIFSAATVHPARLSYGFYPILHFLLMGLCGAFLTGDIFNLYVWFEVIIISSFVLITLGSERKQLAGAIKYFGLNMLASIIFLTGLGILYGLFGTLNMAELSGQIMEFENRQIVYVCALFFFVAFGIKSAVFPLYFWLPDSYHTPPMAVSAVFAGLLTKVGVYAMMRIFSLMFTEDVFLSNLLLWVAMLTIVSGGVGALVQRNMRKIFSYLIICHIGFMIAGLGLFNEMALAGLTFYLIHDIIAKTNIFFMAGVIFQIRKEESIDRLGGLYQSHPKLSLLMAIPIFALAGIPPLSGFWPKISLVLGGVSVANYAVVGAILFGSILTLFILARVWALAFWKPSPNSHDAPSNGLATLSRKHKVMLLLPVLLLSGLTLAMSFGAEYVQQLAERVAAELLDPQSYLDTVFEK